MPTARSPTVRSPMIGNKELVDHDLRDLVIRRIWTGELLRVGAHALRF
jgi:hypothetical protein